MQGTSACTTQKKRAYYIQNKHIGVKRSGNKRDNRKNSALNILLDLKTLISRTASGPEVTIVRAMKLHRTTINHFSKKFIYDVA